MTYTEIDLDNIPLMIERERLDYKARLGGKGAARHAEPKTLDFILPGDRQLKVVLHYISIDSPTGFPFHRLTCKLQLDGKRISNAKLAELCTSTRRTQLSDPSPIAKPFDDGDLMHYEAIDVI